MKEYGYLPEEQQGVDEFAYTAESISEALRKVQAFAGLPQTGAIDAETKAVTKSNTLPIYRDFARSAYSFNSYFWWGNKICTEVPRWHSILHLPSANLTLASPTLKQLK